MIFMGVSGVDIVILHQRQWFKANTHDLNAAGIASMDSGQINLLCLHHTCNIAKQEKYREQYSGRRIGRLEVYKFSMSMKCGYTVLNRELIVNCTSLFILWSSLSLAIFSNYGPQHYFSCSFNTLYCNM